MRMACAGDKARGRGIHPGFKTSGPKNIFETLPISFTRGDSYLMKHPWHPVQDHAQKGALVEGFHGARGVCHRLPGPLHGFPHPTHLGELQYKQNGTEGSMAPAGSVMASPGHLTGSHSENYNVTRHENFWFAVRWNLLRNTTPGIFHVCLNNTVNFQFKHNIRLIKGRSEIQHGPPTSDSESQREKEIATVVAAKRCCTEDKSEEPITGMWRNIQVRRITLTLNPEHTSPGDHNIRHQKTKLGASVTPQKVQTSFNWFFYTKRKISIRPIVFTCLCASVRYISYPLSAIWYDDFASSGNMHSKL